jgi:uncharacterized membrane protein YphA (DoxX/SURF4 family)
MHIVYLIGRIAFVSTFLASGIFKLLDIAGTVSLIESKIEIPEQVAPLAANIASYAGLSTFQLLVILLAVIEIVFALFIIFNLATRFSAFVLAVVLAVGTFYVHDFWNMTGDVEAMNIDALIKNVAIIGGLLMIMAIGPWRPLGEDYAATR